MGRSRRGVLSQFVPPVLKLEGLPMRVSTQCLRRHTSSVSRTAVRQACRIEPLERRTLLSASWTTVDDFQLVAGKNANAAHMRSDPAGDVFAAGVAWDGTSPHHII